MGPYELYLFKSVVALSLLYAFYWLLLRNETYYSWNRAFLLVSLLVSLVFPVFSFSVASLPPAILTIVLKPVIVGGYLAPTESVKSFDLLNILSIVYISGAVFFCLRFLSSLAKIHFLYFRFPRHKYHGFEAVVLDNDQSPFTFFNILFISRIDFESGKIDEMIVHEKAHQQEFHTVDILLMEIVTIIQWFNPFIWMFRSSLRSEHEFIADNKVLLQGFDTVKYQKMLFEKSLGITSFNLTNNFNYSLLNKRLKMMTTKKSSSAIKLKYFLSMPVMIIVFMLLVVNVTSYAKVGGAYNEGDNGKMNSKWDKVVYVNIELGQSDTVYRESYTPKDTIVYPQVEKMPVCKSGKDADIASFLAQNIIYPKSAIDNNVSADIMVQFVVDEMGKVVNVEVVRVSVSPVDARRATNTPALTELKAEAIRVVSLLDFIPAKQDGKNVKVQYTLPINFVLGDNAVQKK